MNSEQAHKKGNYLDPNQEFPIIEQEKLDEIIKILEGLFNEVDFRDIEQNFKTKVEEAVAAYREQLGLAENIQLKLELHQVYRIITEIDLSDKQTKKLTDAYENLTDEYHCCPGSLYLILASIYVKRIQNKTEKPYPLYALYWMSKKASDQITEEKAKMEIKIYQK